MEYNDKLNMLFNRTQGNIKRTGYIGYDNSVEFIIKLPAEVWHREYKNRLGRLVVDFGNYLSRTNTARWDTSKPPSIGGTDKRCRNGVKTLRIEYYNCNVDDFEGDDILTGPINGSLKAV